MIPNSSEHGSQTCTARKIDDDAILVDVITRTVFNANDTIAEFPLGGVTRWDLERDIALNFDPLLLVCPKVTIECPDGRRIVYEGGH